MVFNLNHGVNLNLCTYSSEFDSKMFVLPRVTSYYLTNDQAGINKGFSYYAVTIVVCVLASFVGIYSNLSLLIFLIFFFLS